MTKQSQDYHQYTIPHTSPDPNWLEQAIIAIQSLGGTKPNRMDLAVGKHRLAKLEQKLTDNDFDIKPVTGAVPRVVMDRRDLSPQVAEAMGYGDGGPAIPELGQLNFKTWRKPFTYEHLHRHPDFWTLHRDKHPSMGQIFKGQAKPNYGHDLGTKHVTLEGVPGLARYVAGAIGGGQKFTAGLKPRFSLYKTLGIDAPRSRQEFLTDVYDHGTGYVDQARTDTLARLGIGLGGLALTGAMAYGINKLRKHEKEAQVADTDVDRANYISGGLAGLGISGKGLYDIQKPLSIISEGTNAATKLTQPPRSLVNDLKAIDAYTSTGQKALNSRVLGMRLPYLGVRELNPIVQGRYAQLAKNMYADKARLPFISENTARRAGDVLASVFENSGVTPTGVMAAGINKLKYDAGYRPGSAVATTLNDIAESRKHYDIFAKAHTGVTAKHLLDEAFTTHLPEAKRNLLGKEVWDIINNNSGKPIGTATYAGNLMHAAKTPQARQAIKDGIRIAADLNMLGPKSRMQNYANIGRSVGVIGRGLGVAGLGASALALYKGLRGNQKQAQTITNDELGAGAAGVVGTGLVGKGIHTIARPLDVGVTWGEAPVWGQGHKGPGRVLHGVLSDYQKQHPEFRLTQALRGIDAKVTPMQPSQYKGVESLRKVPGHKFDLLFDTGMGAGVPGTWAGDTGNEMSLLKRIRYNLSRPTSRLGGHVAYQTDVAPGVAAGTATSTSSVKGSRTRGTGVVGALRRRFMPNQFKDTLINYGMPELAKDNPEFINLRTSNLATPLIDKATVKTLGEVGDRSTIINELLQNKSVNLSDNTRKLISDIQNNGKRVLVISGSGRGDQVAVKALRTQNMLKRMGLSDKVQVVALQGGAANYTPYARLLENHPDIASIGFVPNKLFTRLPSIGDLHWGSTGTSSLYESLATPVPFAQTQDAERWRNLETRSLKGERGLALMRQSGMAQTPAEADKLTRALGYVELDKWNRGNKMLANRLGTTNVQSPKSVIQTLMAQDKGTMHQAQSRAYAVRNALTQSQENLRGFLPQIFNRAKRLKQLRGVGQLGLGASLLGTAYGLSRAKPITAVEAPVMPQTWKDKVQEWLDMAKAKLTD